MWLTILKEKADCFRQVFECLILKWPVRGERVGMSATCNFVQVHVVAEHDICVIRDEFFAYPNNDLSQLLTNFEKHGHETYRPLRACSWAIEDQ